MVRVVYMIKEVEFIVSGSVQGVGYRQFVAKIGRKLKLAGFVENLEDGTARIQCKGEENAISEFRGQINAKEPNAAPLVFVEGIKEAELPQGTIKETIFREKYSDSNSEMAQGFSTGMNYLNHFNTKTQSSFAHMDENYDKISQGMFAVVDSMGKRMEKTDKNIESLLKILAEKGG